MTYSIYTFRRLTGNAVEQFHEGEAAQEEEEDIHACLICDTLMTGSQVSLVEVKPCSINTDSVAPPCFPRVV